ncbi:hypothetical protein [Nocardioides convexus]|uniref:hypothetical protein n=1 Tax=Nocardioides convexus TaxID=2712224 RepID=UPI0031019292
MSSSNALAEASAVAERVAHLAATDWSTVAGPDAVEAAMAIASARSLLDAALLGATTQARGHRCRHGPRLGLDQGFPHPPHRRAPGHRRRPGPRRRATAGASRPCARPSRPAGSPFPRPGSSPARSRPSPAIPRLRAAVADRMLALVEEHGHNATALQTAFADVVREVDPDGLAVAADLLRDKAERGAHHARYLSFAEDGLGGVRVRGYGTVEDAERIKSVLLPLAAPQVTEPGSCGGASGRDQPMFDAEGRATTIPCPTSWLPARRPRPAPAGRPALGRARRRLRPGSAPPTPCRATTGRCRGSW